MQVGELGNTFGSTTKIKYDSNEVLYEYDMIFINIDYIFGQYQENASYPITLFGRFQKRKNEIAEFLSIFNKYVICYIPSPKTLSAGNNKINILQLVDNAYNTTVPSVGRGMTILESPFKSFFKQFEKHFSYSNHFSKPFGMPLIKIEHTNKIISALENKILYFPLIAKKIDDEKNFFESIYAILESIYNKKINSDLPEWSNKYYFIDERQKLTQLKKLEEKIQLLEDERKLLETQIQDIKILKHLFTGTGKILEYIVEKVLIELGFTIEKRDTMNKDDIIAHFDKQILIVEVKGVTGTAAQKNARQLENWVSDYEPEQENTLVKGLLVVNSFKDLPIENRKDPTFPHQMLDYSEKREHCLITGLQLLGIIFSIRNDNSKKEDIINSIFLTNGIYKGYEDWSEYIQTNKLITSDKI